MNAVRVTSIKQVVLVYTLVCASFAPLAAAHTGNSVALRTSIGSSCSQNAECGEGSHCIEDKETRNGAVFAGGYCVKFDCSVLSPCDVGAKCVQPEEVDFSLCLASCLDDTHCRNGYACHEEGVCLPANP